MKEEDVQKISLQIDKMLEELLPTEPLETCFECGGACIQAPDTGLYTCQICGIEQQEEPLVAQRRFLSEKERKELCSLPIKRWKSTAERAKKRVSNEILRICVDSRLSPKTAEKFISVSKNLFQALRKEDLIKGRGRTIEKVVFAIMYEALWIEFFSVVCELNKEFSLQDSISELIKAFGAKNGEELIKMRKRSKDLFEGNKPILQKFMELRKAIAYWQTKYGGLVRKAQKHMAYFYTKSSVPYYLPQKADPSTSRLTDSSLYRLFELDSFRGEIVDNDEGYRRCDHRKIVPAAVTYTNEVKTLSGQLFHSFLQSLSPEKSKRKRKGLVCVCTYVSGYLMADYLMGLSKQLTGQFTPEDLKTIPFPKSRKRWMDFFGISKGTFYERLKELEMWNPKLLELVKELEKIHSGKI